MIGSFRQSMTWLHTWSGLVVGWLLFFIFVTGTVGYFDTEIDLWMQPERPVIADVIDPREALIIAEKQLQKNAPKAKRWRLYMPVSRNITDIKVQWDLLPDASGKPVKRQEKSLDLKGEELKYRDTAGGQQLYKMHYLFHYIPNIVATILVGVCTMIMLVALTTGVIAHRKIFKEFFTFRASKHQRSWLDIHNMLGVLALPFHFMITYSGLLFFLLTLMPLIFVAVYEGDQVQAIKDTQMFVEPITFAGEPAEMKPLVYFYDEVQDINGNAVEVITVDYPNSENARVSVRELNDRLSNITQWHFSAVSGEALNDGNLPITTEFYLAFMGTHEGLFAGPALRWMYFISGIFGTGMIATGLVLWVQKRRAKYQRKAALVPLNLRLIEKVNIATILGFLTAIAAYFWANRLLPVAMDNRAEWEIHTLFITWLVMFFHALSRPRPNAWKEQLIIASAAFCFLPVLNALSTTRGFVTSLVHNDWIFIGFDLTVLSIGALLAIAAILAIKSSFDDTLNSNSNESTIDGYASTQLEEVS